MAIVCAHGKLDLFITMTMNPNHPDIMAALLPEQSPSDQPDIITHVFKGLLDMLICDIKDKIFGKIVAYTYSIEYQAHGLPHACILVFLHTDYKFETSDDIDHVICAEIPEDHGLQELVVKYMCHGPFRIFKLHVCMKACALDIIQKIFQQKLYGITQ